MRATEKRRRGRTVAASVEEIQGAIRRTQLERERLRDHRAGPGMVEANRLTLVRLQWEFSYALIEEHRRGVSRAAAAA